jgi:protein-tyrosine-phosphatase
VAIDPRQSVDTPDELKLVRRIERTVASSAAMVSDERHRPAATNIAVGRRSKEESTANPMRVLFLCTDNAARPPMAETLLRQITKGQVEAHSAGTNPSPALHPMAVATMRDRYDVDISSQRPQTFEPFVGQALDAVITLCDRAGEACPVFPGDSVHIHWSFPDPAAVEGGEDEQRRAFERVASDIASRQAGELEDRWEPLVAQLQPDGRGAVDSLREQCRRVETLWRAQDASSAGLSSRTSEPCATCSGCT